MTSGHRGLRGWSQSFLVPVEPVKQMSTTIVTTGKPFIPPVQSFYLYQFCLTTGGVSIQPVQSVTGTSSVQATCVVTQRFRSQPLTGAQYKTLDRSTGPIVLTSPVRDACLYMREVTLPDPHFLFAIASQPQGGFFSYLAGVCSSPGKFF